MRKGWNPGGRDEVAHSGGRGGGTENGPKVFSPEWPLPGAVDTVEGTGLGIAGSLILERCPLDTEEPVGGW